MLRLWLSIITYVLLNRTQKSVGYLRILNVEVLKDSEMISVDVSMQNI